MLEQFVAGLKTLVVIDAIRRYPTQFLKLFVHSKVSKIPSFLKGLLKLFTNGENDKCTKVFNMLLKYIDECSEEGIVTYLLNKLFYHKYWKVIKFTENIL